MEGSPATQMILIPTRQMRSPRPQGGCFPPRAESWEAISSPGTLTPSPGLGPSEQVFQATGLATTLPQPVPLATGRTIWSRRDVQVWFPLACSFALLWPQGAPLAKATPRLLSLAPPALALVPHLLIFPGAVRSPQATQPLALTSDQQKAEPRPYQPPRTLPSF